jgi:hypothetical protein
MSQKTEKSSVRIDSSSVEVSEHVKGLKTSVGVGSV